MNKPPDDRLNSYYAEAEGWAHDRQQSLRASRRIAWIIAGIAVAVASLEAIALAALAPLKTVVPYTVLVDRQTGFVQGLDPLDLNRISPDEALTRSFLAQYVIARESFDVASVQSDYRKVALWSAERARSDYLAQMQPGNPQSPFQRYPPHAMVTATVKSVSPLSGNVALIRFETTMQQGSAQPVRTGAWAAILRYRFSSAPLSAADRFINPLGFHVLRYRRDPETIAAADLAPPAALPGQPQR